jgi:hypothetical protein
MPDPQGSFPEEQVERGLTAITTEHFVLQTARAATVAEANGRVNVFLGAVSGALVALGFVAQASKLGAAFDVLALLLLPVLAYIGIATQERVVQTGIEDAAYARRISLLRRFYVDIVPDLAPYLQRPDPEGGPGAMPGDVSMPMARMQVLLSSAGLVAVVTSVLIGSSAGMLIGVVGFGLALACTLGAAVAVAGFVLLITRQRRAWQAASSQ